MTADKRAEHLRRVADQRIAQTLDDYAAEFDTLRRSTTQEVTVLRLMIKAHRPDLADRARAAHAQLATVLAELAAISTQTAGTLRQQLCGCEVPSCPHAGRPVAAGRARAAHAGRICDECAAVCLAESVVLP